MNPKNMQVITVSVTLKKKKRQLCGFLEMRLLYQYIAVLIKQGISLIREINFKKLKQDPLFFHQMRASLLQKVLSEREEKSKLSFGCLPVTGVSSHT